MNIQINVIVENIKKNCVWFILFIGLVFFKALSILLEISKVDIVDDVSLLLSMPRYMNILNLYQIIFVIYFTYKFYTFEFKHSFENIVLRINDSRWLFNKILMLIIFNLILRLLSIFIAYMFFSNRVIFNLNHLLLPFLYYSYVIIQTVLIINILKKQELFVFITSLLCAYLTFIYLDYPIVIILLFAFILINFKIFKFKTILK